MKSNAAFQALPAAVTAASRSLTAVMVLLSLPGSAQACFGPENVEDILYCFTPISLLFLTLSTALVLKLLVPLLVSRENVPHRQRDVNAGLNCIFLAYWCYASAFLFFEILDMKSAHGPLGSLGRDIAPLIIVLFNPFSTLLAAAISYRSAPPWVRCLFGRFLLAPGSVVAVATLTSVFEGRCGAPVWPIDEIRLTGLFLFVLLLYAVYESIPKPLRPFACSDGPDLSRAIGALRNGFEFVMDSTGDAQSTCVFCNQSLAGEVVRCDHCGILAHSECWEYGGKHCVVYGCPGRSATAVTTKKPFTGTANSETSQKRLEDSILKGAVTQARHPEQARRSRIR